MVMEVDVSDYTIEDLKDRYVETRTIECCIFLRECLESGILGCEVNSAALGEGLFEYIEYCNHGSGYKIYGVNSKGDLKLSSKPFTIKPQWTPQTNTMPLRELSDEQAAQLFNAWRGGARIESPGEMILSNMPSWDPDFVYRVMKKSPKQEFVDSIIEHYKGSTFLDNSVIDMLESAYDAGLFK